MSEKSLKRSLSEILHWRHDSKLWHHNHFFPFPYRICSTKSDFDIVHDISYLLILILLNMTVELRRKFSRSFIFFKKIHFLSKTVKKIGIIGWKSAGITKFVWDLTRMPISFKARHALLLSCQIQKDSFAGVL